MGNGYKWFRSVCGETVDYARDIAAECFDADDAACEAAEMLHENSGCEWVDGKRVIDIIAPDGTITRHEVTIEWSPTFSAEEVTNG